MDKAIVMAGGTGGHIFPGIAIANSLIAKGWDVSWLGSKNGMEEEIVPKAGISLDLISVKGLRGNGIAGWIKMPFTLTSAIWQASKIFKKNKPNVVLGFGGFVSGPGGLACKLLGIKLVIHEQNAVAGMTNRNLARFSDHVFQDFPGAFEESKKVTTVGNPVREAIFEVGKDSNKKVVNKVINILVIGGSRGALALNKHLPKVFASLTADKEIEVVHQVGKGRVAETKAVYQSLDMIKYTNIKIFEFIEDMAKAFSKADLVICRAGASTVSEIAAAGNAAVFIPYPYAVDDHQTANAKWLVERDAALMFKESEMEKEVFIEVLKKLVDSPEIIEEMAKNAKAAAMTDATSIITEYCEKFRKRAA